MQRRCLITLAAIAVACSPIGELGDLPSRGVARHAVIGVSAPDSIFLGRAWENAAKYGARAGDTLTRVAQNHFSGMDAVTVHRNATGIVTDIEFAYHARRDIPALVAGLREVLGEPTSNSTNKVSGSTRAVIRWCDESTVFVLTTIVPAGADSIGAISLLRDRTSTLATSGYTRNCS
jgi:hypothetical protein